VIGGRYIRAMTRVRLPALVVLAAALALPGCAGPRASKSEIEWQRGQCAQVIDAKARERCLERVDSQ